MFSDDIEIDSAIKPGVHLN